MHATYRAVFFDVGNTLLLPNPSVADICAEVLGTSGCFVDRGRLGAAVAVADQAYEERYRQDDTFWMNESGAAKFWIDLYELMLKEAGVEEQTENLARDIYDEFGFAERWQPYPDVIPALATLVDAGYKIGLISNWDTRLTSISIETGLSRYIDFVISSANVGYIKPQPEIFELALERADVRASEAIHVGDHYYADIMGARSVGITPVLIDREDQVSQSDCLVINDLQELCHYLRAH